MENYDIISVKQRSNTFIVAYKHKTTNSIVVANIVGITTEIAEFIERQ